MMRVEITRDDDIMSCMPGGPLSRPNRRTKCSMSIRLCCEGLAILTQKWMSSIKAKGNATMMTEPLTVQMNRLSR
jgi:hypothetical protein